MIDNGNLYKINNIFYINFQLSKNNFNKIIYIEKLIFLVFIFILIFYFEKKNYLEQINIKKINNLKPKISIFLPIYNKEKYIKRSIKSIQEQSLKQIEIIAVNDCSTDNSLKILKELASKDFRIKIVNNLDNRGLLFSRAMGMINCKGEYLMNLDPDDEFRGSNILKFLYNKAKRTQVDMIIFLLLYLPQRNKIGILSRSNKILVQPEIFKTAFKDNSLYDYYITNKLIKKNLVECVYNIFKKNIYGKKWNYHEDNIWSILFHKYSNSSLFINKVVYYYYQNSDSEMMNRGNILEMKNILYKFNMYKQIFNTKSNEKYLLVGYYQLFYSFKENINIIKENNEIKNNFINNMRTFINNYNVSKNITKEITNFINDKNL